MESFTVHMDSSKIKGVPLDRLSYRLRLKKEIARRNTASEITPTEMINMVRSVVDTARSKTTPLRSHL